jgi:hypothetical protein
VRVREWLHFLKPFFLTSRYIFFLQCSRHEIAGKEVLYRSSDVVLSENRCVFDNKIDEERLSNFVPHHLVAVRKVRVRDFQSVIFYMRSIALCLIYRNAWRNFYARHISNIECPLNTEKLIVIFR